MNPTFTTINDPKDPTFNQLLGINDEGKIAGYFGSGMTDGQGVFHPNKGYTLQVDAHRAQFTNENLPGSVQTQVTGINNVDRTVGFEVDAAGNSFGFIEHDGHFTKVVDPNALVGGANVNEQLLGVNDFNQAVGFYTDANAQNHGFIYDATKGTTTDLSFSGWSNVSATSINDKGQIAGFGTFHGATEGFFDDHGKVTALAGPSGATDVNALGLNNKGQIVGSYVGTDTNTHGFVYDVRSNTYQTIDAPGANGQTVINGLNDRGQLVGFYLDANNNTDGLLVQLPTHHTS